MAETEVVEKKSDNEQQGKKEKSTDKAATWAKLENFVFWWGKFAWLIALSGPAVILLIVFLPILSSMSFLQGIIAAAGTSVEGAWLFDFILLVAAAAIGLVITFFYVFPIFSKKCAAKDWDFLANDILSMGKFRVSKMFLFGALLGFGWWACAAVLLPAFLLLFLGPVKVTYIGATGEKEISKKEKPVKEQKEKKPKEEKTPEKVEEKPLEKKEAKIPAKPAAKPVAKPAAKPIAKPAAKPVAKPAEPASEAPAETPVEEPVIKPAKPAKKAAKPAKKAAAQPTEPASEEPAKESAEMLVEEPIVKPAKPAKKAAKSAKKAAKPAKKAAKPAKKAAKPAKKAAKPAVAEPTDDS